MFSWVEGVVLVNGGRDFMLRNYLPVWKKNVCLFISRERFTNVYRRSLVKNFGGKKIFLSAWIIFRTNEIS